MLYQRTSQEDLEAGADLLYDLVETAYLKEKAIPNEIELIKEARLNFGCGIKDSFDCIELMKQKYRNDLREKGYFGKLKSKEDLERKFEEEGICWHGDIHDTGF